MKGYLRPFQCIVRLYRYSNITITNKNKYINKISSEVQEINLYHKFLYNEGFALLLTKNRIVIRHSESIHLHSM